MRSLAAAIAVVTLAIGLAGCASRSASRGPAPATGSYSAPARSTGGGVAFDGQDPTLEQALDGGRHAGKPVVFYFLASWCGFCSKLERNTLSKPEVGAEMSRFYNVRCDPDNPAGRALALKYGVNGFPTLVFVDGSGNSIRQQSGASEPADFISRVRMSGRTP